MRFLLAFTMICVLFGVSYAQKSDVHAIGKDSDGDMWYVDTTLVVRPQPPADWLLIVPMYTLLDGRTLVFYFNVDCSDSTYQFRKAQSLNRQGETLWEKDEKSAWARFTGYTGTGARVVCNKLGNRPSTKLPVTNGKEVDGR